MAHKPGVRPLSERLANTERTPGNRARAGLNTSRLSAQLIERSLAGTHEPGNDVPAPPRRAWPKTLVPAAVLVPLLERAEGLHVILTERAAGLTRHAGQIAFPGGRIDPGDAGPLDAALREAEEEIGLPPGLVKPIGYLRTYVTVTGYAVVPVVGLIGSAFEMRLDPAEVSAAFDAPLDHLLDPNRHFRFTHRVRGIDVAVDEILYGERRIWGATAAMLVDFSRRVSVMERRSGPE